MSLTVAEIKQIALREAPTLARELVPGGKFSGVWYSAKSPLRPDRHAGSFAIRIAGEAMVYKDFASGDQGDVVDLVAEVKFGGKTREARGAAIGWLKHRLGLSDVKPPEARAIRQRAAADRRAAEQREAHERAAKIQRCMDIFHAGKPLGGTLGEVYLRSRGIDAASVPDKAATFRFHERLDYWKGGVAYRGPAIVGRYRDEAGRFPAIHATWLREDGLGKADLAPAKLSFGSYAGCFLPITHGAGGKPHWDADAPAGLVMIAEGPEDAWSLSMGEPSLRCWAAGSLSNIGNLPAPPCVGGFLVVRQNDWDTPAAVRGFERAIETLERHGLPISIIESGFGKDPNDQLRGRK